MRGHMLHVLTPAPYPGLQLVLTQSFLSCVLKPESTLHSSAENTLLKCASAEKVSRCLRCSLANPTKWGKSGFSPPVMPATLLCLYERRG
eukprot:1152645-Pelagomonas_calceolata.AAC.3